MAAPVADGAAPRAGHRRAAFFDRHPRRGLLAAPAARFRRHLGADPDLAGLLAALPLLLFRAARSPTGSSSAGSGTSRPPGSARCSASGSRTIFCSAIRASSISIPGRARRADISGAPFGAIKDVAILSAMAGNVVTLILFALAYPMLGRADLGIQPHMALLSVVIIVGPSLLALDAARPFVQHAGARKPASRSPSISSASSRPSRSPSCSGISPCPIFRCAGG